VKFNLKYYFSTRIHTTENMKTTLLSFFLCIFFFNPGEIYEFKVNSLKDDTQINLSDFRGKKILVVNIASKSPYTFQMEQLENLYSAYKGKLVVVGLSAGDDFEGQELKTNADIRDFYTYVYNISFPMSEKVSALGSMRHPIFAYLVEEAKKMGMDDPVIKWNFTKFLLDENGKLMKVFGADILPLSTDITDLLNNSRNWDLNK